jgi:hypothetical protein
MARRGQEVCRTNTIARHHDLRPGGWGRIQQNPADATRPASCGLLGVDLVRGVLAELVDRLWQARGDLGQFLGLDDPALCLQAKSRHKRLAPLGHYVRLGEETSASNAAENDPSQPPPRLLTQDAMHGGATSHCWMITGNEQ